MKNAHIACIFFFGNSPTAKANAIYLFRTPW